MELDARGLKCPMPIVRLTQTTRQAGAGDEIRVLADDPAFGADVKAWCRKTGNTLVSLETSGSLSTAVVKKEG